MTPEIKCQIWTQNHICFPKGALDIVLVEYYLKPVATTILMCNTGDLGNVYVQDAGTHLQCTSAEAALLKQALCRQHWRNRARWTDSWLKGQAQRLAISGKKVLVGGQEVSVLPRGQYWAKHCSNASINDVTGGTECTLSKSGDKWKEGLTHWLVLLPPCRTLACWWNGLTGTSSS